jgi:transcription antitermination factor NusG
LTQTPWYALKVKPRFERAVVAHLRGRGYDPFLPIYTARRRWSDRVKSIELPLFPGYLFCQFDLNNRLPILTAPGVSFIVGIGNVPQPVADHEIEAVGALSAPGCATNRIHTCLSANSFASSMVLSRAWWGG